jgi:hypothetical protein
LSLMQILLQIWSLPEQAMSFVFSTESDMQNSGADICKLFTACCNSSSILVTITWLSAKHPGLRFCWYVFLHACPLYSILKCYPYKL